MKITNHKKSWHISKSKSSHNIVVVENRNKNAISATGSVHIHCFSDEKIRILRGIYK